MNLRTVTLATVAMATIVGIASAGDPLVYESRALEDMAKLIRQDPAQLRWRDIPWFTDAGEGIKVARAEKRPVLLFVSGDNPLGRC
jgi:hypothetical protein